MIACTSSLGLAVVHMTVVGLFDLFVVYSFHRLCMLDMIELYLIYIG